MYLKREDCPVRLYQQGFYSEGANVKIVIAHVNSMLLIKGQTPEIPSSLSSDKINDKRKIDNSTNDILSIQREKDQKRELVISSITVEVQCFGGCFAFA